MLDKVWCRALEEFPFSFPTLKFLDSPKHPDKFSFKSSLEKSVTTRIRFEEDINRASTSSCKNVNTSLAFAFNIYFNFFSILVCSTDVIDDALLEIR